MLVSEKFDQSIEFCLKKNWNKFKINKLKYKKKISVRIPICLDQFGPFERKNNRLAAL